MKGTYLELYMHVERYVEKHVMFLSSLKEHKYKHCLYTM